MRLEAERELLKGVSSLFIEEDAYYMSLGDKGYAICWLTNSIKTEKEEQIYLKFFDVKGWSRGDEILVASVIDKDRHLKGHEPSIIKYPVLRYYDTDYIVISWVEDFNDVYIQIIDLEGNLIGDRVKSRAFQNLAHSREGVEIILDILFSNKTLT